MDQQTWSRGAGAVVVACAVACSPGQEFCQAELECEGDGCPDAGGAAAGSCITFEEAAQLAEDPNSGVRTLIARGDCHGEVLPTARNDNAICRGETCYVKGNGAVSIYAAPHTQNLFEHWSGCSDGTDPMLQLNWLRIRRHTECVAHFAPALIVINTGVQGWYYADPVQISADGCQSTSNCVVPYGGSATLVAPTSERYRFIGWSGCSTSTEPTLVLTNLREMPPPCIARFEPIAFEVSWEVDGEGGTVESRTSGPDYVCDEDSCAVVTGGSLAIEAVPSAGYVFERWSDCATSSEPSLGLSEVREARRCVAHFTPVPAL